MTRQQMIDSIIKECYKQEITKPEAIQYVLATVQHETNDTFQPVVEAYWIRDKYIKKLGEKKGLKKFDAWARRNFRYYPFYGRGLVQLTWERNYKRYTNRLSKRYNANIDLVVHPEFALYEHFAIFILVDGMKHGIFTGKKLDDYFNEKGSNFIGARRIINGRDKAKKIAALAQIIEIA